MRDAATIDRIRRKFKPLRHALDERARRLWAATEALDLGWGGVTAVAEATGLSRTTIRAGIVEIQKKTPSASPRSSSSRRRPQVADPARPRVAGRVGGIGRTDGAWRTGLSLAMDHPQYAGAGQDAHRPRARRQPHHGGESAEGGWFQLAGQSQDAGRRVASRPRRPIRVHQPACQAIRASRSAGRLRGYEEEGIGRGFQERRPRVPPPRPARRSAGAMTSRTRNWARRCRTAFTTWRTTKVG